jgi:hypothetical protein
MYYIMITINVVHSEISVSGVENLQRHQLLICSISDTAFQCTVNPVSVFLTLKNVTFRALDTEFWLGLTSSSDEDHNHNPQNPESQYFEHWLSVFYTLMFGVFTSHSVGTRGEHT